MDNSQPSTVTLSIPCAPEYVGTARLTILGVASRLGFTYDQIEDIRLAVGEACTNAIGRAKHGGAAPPGQQPLITIRSLVEPTQLTVEVEDNVVGATEGDSEIVVDGDGTNSHELGSLLMEILVDDFRVEEVDGGGTRVRLVKRTSTE
jgi:serine/threonine-protein kinase RsbW